MQLAGRELNPDLGWMIERDRVIAARKPGLIQKLLPLSSTEHGMHSGGVHLFDTMENARRYARWCTTTDEMGPTKFLDRYGFLEPASQFFDLIDAEDFADVATSQQLMRFERWYSPSGELDELREKLWPRVRENAIAAGNSTAWLMFDNDRYHPQVALATTMPSPQDELGKIGPAYRAFESQPSPAAEMLANEWDATKAFDRTSWTYQIWFPETGNPADVTTLWPHGTALPHL